MATITKINTRQYDIGIVKSYGVVIKVEKWSETHFSTTTDVSGGGGFIYEGTGRIDAINVRTTTSANTSRHTRIYYRTLEGLTQTLTAYGSDLEVMEHAEIQIAWYRCPGFQDKVAGFLDLTSNHWFLLNDYEAYFMNWLGISWISPMYLLKYFLVLAGISWVCFMINFHLGVLISFFMAIGFLFSMGKILFGFLFRFPTYSLKGEMDRAGVALRQEFISAVTTRDLVRQVAV